MSMRKYSKGVMSLPFKLILIGIVLAFTVSIGYTGLNTYSKSAAENNLRIDCERIISTAKKVDSMGINTTLGVSVDIKGSMLHSVVNFEIGYILTKPLNPKSFSIRYRISGGEEKSVYAYDDSHEPLPMCGEDGGSVILSPGEHRILLTKAFSDRINSTYILVKVKW